MSTPPGKVGGSEDSIRAAAQRFLNQQEGIDTFTSEVLAGALRSIVGRLTIEEIIRDRAAFASAVAEEAESSLTGQGLVLDTFQLQDIQAEGSYLADLGRPEAARVLKEASIAEARANAAGPLAQAAQDQAILAEQEKVAVRTASLTERQLDTKVRRPADAERYRVEQEAEGRKNSAILTAEAQRQATIAAAQAAAEQAKLSGEGERARRSALAEAEAEAIEGAKRGEAEKLRREAIADAVEREGSAEAAAIPARGQAEAEALDARSDAFAKYGEAAILEMLVKVLPEVVGAAAAPLSAVDRMTVISSDGAGSLGKSVAANVAQGLQLSGDLTGIDVTALLRRLSGATGTDGVARVPITSDGDGAAGNGVAGNGRHA